MLHAQYRPTPIPRRTLQLNPLKRSALSALSGDIATRRGQVVGYAR